MEKWTIQDSKEAYSQRIFTLKDLTCYHPGKDLTHSFMVLNTADWINVIATTPEGEFIMVRQHRLGTDEFTLETPGGIIEQGEPPEQSALRELLEETGFRARGIRLLKRLAVNPAIMNNYIYYFHADNCVRVAGQDLDPAEDIEVVTCTRGQIESMVESGEMDHSLIITGLNLFFAEER